MNVVIMSDCPGTLEVSLGYDYSYPTDANPVVKANTSHNQSIDWELVILSGSIKYLMPRKWWLW